LSFNERKSVELSCGKGPPTKFLSEIFVKIIQVKSISGLLNFIKPLMAKLADFRLFENFFAAIKARFFVQAWEIDLNDFIDDKLRAVTAFVDFFRKATITIGTFEHRGFLFKKGRQFII
jgi:hypothetical protein